MPPPLDAIGFVVGVAIANNGNRAIEILLREGPLMRPSKSFPLPV